MPVLVCGLEVDMSSASAERHQGRTKAMTGMCLAVLVSGCCRERYLCSCEPCSVRLDLVASWNTLQRKCHTLTSTEQSRQRKFKQKYLCTANAKCVMQQARFVHSAVGADSEAVEGGGTVLSKPAKRCEVVGRVSGQNNDNGKDKNMTPFGSRGLNATQTNCMFCGQVTDVYI